MSNIQKKVLQSKSKTPMGVHDSKIEYWPSLTPLLCTYNMTSPCINVIGHATTSYVIVQVQKEFEVFIIQRNLQEMFGGI